ncbi:MAG: hypothetical protein NZ772_15250, partial [Cyanobacteria bacterium]|nr:hypothetical protein [Cyanobacteriota bacterium]MDW8201594.1 hypothetical protein [Cyanobacteriota bacterium SKYGB_h_bin112]
MGRADENIATDDVILTEVAPDSVLKRLHTSEQFMREQLVKATVPWLPAATATRIERLSARADASLKEL